MKKYILICLFLSISNVSFGQQNSKNAMITNLSYELIPQYELPKRYIIDNHSTLYPKENGFRRADIIFFLSIPITYFLVQNILNFINILNIGLENYNSDLGRDNFGFTSGEWNYILAAVFLIPLGVTIYDAVYVKEYPLLPPFKMNEFKEVRMNFTIYRTKF